MKTGISNRLQWLWPMIFLATHLFAQGSPLPISKTLVKNEKGESVELQSFKGKDDILVLLFVSSKCPITTLYWSRIKGTWYNFREKGVRMLIVGGNSDDSLEAIQASLKEKNLEISVCWNEQFSIAKSFGVNFTPTAVVLGKNWNMLYRGRLDDSWRVESQIKERYLDSAIANALDNKQSKDHHTEPFMGSRIR